MKRWIAILLCTAMLVGVLWVPVYADGGDGNCPGACPETSFIDKCVGWLRPVVTAFADALGIHVHVTGTVGNLPTGYDQDYRVRMALDGSYQCASCDNTDNVSLPVGTQLYDESFPSIVDGNTPYVIDETFKVDTATAHTIGVYVGQEGCANCPHVGSVAVEPYVPPPPVCDGTVIGYEWYECNSGSWTYGPTTSAECAWCNGLSGNRVVKESYDCGESWHWYYNGTPVSGPPVPLGFYKCGTAACQGN
jgi:hypothetical protein